MCVCIYVHNAKGKNQGRVRWEGEVGGIEVGGGCTSVTKGSGEGTSHIEGANQTSAVWIYARGFRGL